MDEGIIDVDDRGRCRLPGLNTVTGYPTEPGWRVGSGGLFTKPVTALKSHVVQLVWREYLSQVIALSELVIDYGWPKEMVGFDPEARGAWTFDLAVFRDAASTPPWILAGETKSPSTAPDLDALVAALRTWADTESVPPPGDSTKTAKAMRGLLRTRPTFLWLRAPGRRAEAFRLTFEEDRLGALEPVPDIPKYSAVN